MICILSRRLKSPVFSRKRSFSELLMRPSLNRRQRGRPRDFTRRPRAGKLHPYRVREFDLMTVDPGPLGRAEEWQAFSLLHPKRVQVHSPGQRPGKRAWREITTHPEGVQQVMVFLARCGRGSASRWLEKTALRVAATLLLELSRPIQGVSIQLWTG
jgi:hypothetical protein